MTFSQLIIAWVGHMTFNQQCWLAVVVLIAAVLLINTLRKAVALGVLWVSSKVWGIPLEELCEDYNAEYCDNEGMWR